MVCLLFPQSISQLLQALHKSNCKTIHTSPPTFILQQHATHIDFSIPILIASPTAIHPSIHWCSKNFPLPDQLLLHAGWLISRGRRGRFAWRKKHLKAARRQVQQQRQGSQWKGKRDSGNKPHFESSLLRTIHPARDLRNNGPELRTVCTLYSAFSASDEY